MALRPRRTPRTRAVETRDSAVPPRRTCVAYARVSSKDQEREGFSIPAQQRLIQSYAAQHGFDIVEEYVDIETAKKTGRTNYVRMIQWLKRNAKSCNVILVEKTDRLYRNLKDWVDLDALGVEIHLVKEGTVLSQEARSSEKFMHGIRVLMAKNYIDNLAEEATKGMKEKAAQGIWPTTAPLGYVNVRLPNGKKGIALDPERAPLVKSMFELAGSGAHSLSSLTKFMYNQGLRTKGGAKLHRSNIHKILHNPLYCGEIHWRGKVYKGIHEPLISSELFERVQLVLAGRYQHQREGQRADTFAFVGLILCEVCGCALSAEIKKERYVYYRCTQQRGECEQRYVREEILEEQFTAYLKGLHFSDVTYEWMKNALFESQIDQERHHREVIARLEGECARLQKRIDQMYMDKLDGVVDSEFFALKSAEWREEQRVHRRSIQKHEEANEAYMAEGVALIDLSRSAYQIFEKRSPSEKRKLLNFLLQNSTWGGDHLKVEWRKPFDILAQFADAARTETPPDQGNEGGVSNLVTPTGFEPVLPR